MPLGQSKKAIDDESQIGPCVATHKVDNRQACWFQEMTGAATTRKWNHRESSADSGGETKPDIRPEEDHARIEYVRSNSWAECREKKLGTEPKGRCFS
jgi:hypothetical protein